MDMKDLMKQVRELKEIYEKKIEEQNIIIEKLKKENEKLRRIHLKNLNGSLCIEDGAITIKLEKNKSSTFIQNGSLRNYKKGK